ncbi:1-acyl-sn-glycerol-3-phosphate acyltransferase [Nevskia sp.]|uniref:lysophospholipid acyltransferase family protein n=1 Tax=Nevskia sp. TaxID=1929292 RepID=UPI0025D9DE84|nr:lysophospholipid acyltransferase family protein [Nevskia sp.]
MKVDDADDGGNKPPITLTAPRTAIRLTLVPDHLYRPTGLPAWIRYRWRQLRTGIAFALFGLAGLVFAPLVLPLARIGAGDPAKLRRRVQWIVSRWFGAFSHAMRLLGLIRWDIQGADKLKRRGQLLIIANHPSLIDVVLLLGYIPESDCIVKQALFRNPFTRKAVTWAGYISNSTPTQLVTDCSASLKAGRSLLIFPEGTRTVPGEPIRIPHAAARIALESVAEILPVSIRCEPVTLTKRQAWYRVPARRVQYTIVVGEPYSAAPWLAEAPSMAIAARRLSRHWEQWFTRQWAAPPLPDVETASAGR